MYLRTTFAFSPTNLYGTGEMSVKQLDQLAQQAFSEQFLMQGSTDEYDLSAITVPVKNIYVNDDLTCVNEAAKEHFEEINTIQGEATLYGYDHSQIVGNNNDDFYYQVLSMLEANQDSVETFDCPSDGTFSSAWTA